MQIPEIPLIGASGLMTIVSLLHILLVSIAGSGPLMAYLIEGVGIRRNDPRFARVAKALVASVLELAVAGGILGSGIVVVLLGQYPPSITLLANVFFWFIVLQLICYIGGLAFLFATYFTFDKPGSRHRTWGLVAAILPLIVKVTFSAAVGFTNNPGDWPSSGNVWAAVFNPMTVPMFLHRLVAGVSLVSYFIVAYALVKARSTATDEERSYGGFALNLGGRIAVWSTLAQILPGLLVLFVGLPPEGRAAVFGPLHMPWVLSIVLMLASVAVLIRWAWQPERGLRSKWILWLTILAIVVASGMMGFTRSQARGSDMMFRVLDEEGQLQEAPEVYLNPPVTGQALFGSNCSACHPGLAGDAVSKARERHPDLEELRVFLREPGAIGIPMPAFPGTDDELDTLTEYLLGK